jgi:hypothetical protein
LITNRICAKHSLAASGKKERNDLLTQKNLLLLTIFSAFITTDGW